MKSFLIFFVFDYSTKGVTKRCTHEKCNHFVYLIPLEFSLLADIDLSKIINIFCKEDNSHKLIIINCICYKYVYGLLFLLLDREKNIYNFIIGDLVHQFYLLINKYRGTLFINNDPFLCSTLLDNERNRSDKIEDIIKEDEKRVSYFLNMMS